MSHLKNRLLVSLIALAFALVTVACTADDRPDNTSPDGSVTTEPVGS